MDLRENSLLVASEDTTSGNIFNVFLEDFRPFVHDMRLEVHDLLLICPIGAARIGSGSYTRLALDLCSQEREFLQSIPVFVSPAQLDNSTGVLGWEEMYVCSRERRYSSCQSL